MASIKRTPSHRARLSRNGHDLSHRTMFTSTSGQLLPVLYDFLSPGESIRINSNLFTRTQPLKTPAFVRITEHIDYFFVPMSQLNEYFGNAFYGIDDSTNPNNFVGGNLQRNPKLAPLLTYGEIYKYLFNASSAVASSNDPKLYTLYDLKNNDEFGISNMSNFLRLASMLGYSEHITTGLASEFQNNNTQQGIGVGFELFAAYQKIFMDYYRNTQWTRDNPYSYSLTYFYKLGSYQSVLNNFGAGTDGDLFKLRYSPLKKDFFTNLLPSPLMTSSGQINSYLNGDGSSSPEALSTTFSNYVLSQWGINPQYLADQLKQMTSLDSNFEPAYQYGQAGGMEKVKSSILPFVDGIDTTLRSDYSEDVLSPTDSYPIPAVTASTIRTMFAIDKMKSITRRAKYHYDAQTLAHFGFSVPKGVSNEVYYLGSHSSPLSIGEIAATATTGSGSDSSVLGELAGRGIGVSGKQKKIRFTAPCHGILMAIYRSVPDIDYSAYSVDRQIVNFGNINLLYHPEFDRLGMQPMYLWQFYYKNSFISSGKLSDPLRSAKFFGWQYRFSEYKCKYNIVHGAFNYTLRDWVSTRNGSWFDDNTVTNPSLDATYFYCPPTLFDNIFAVSFDAGKNTDGNMPWAVLRRNGETPAITDYAVISPVFQNDNLLHSIDFKYYKVSTMSTYGLPNL